MIGFALTPRRRETLEILQRLTEQAGEAVHYSLVGARMRISAWTAYGLLRELENMGLVVRRYALEPGKRLGGRSRILFEPAAHRRSLDGEPRASVFVESYNRFRAIPDEAMAATAYLAEAGSDIGFHLGFWLGRLEAAGRHARDAAGTVLEGSAVPAAKIQTVAAIGLGAVLARVGKARLQARMTAAANRFSILLEDAARLPDGQLAMLVERARRLDAPAMPRRIVL
jgi:hypothetical protein